MARFSKNFKRQGFTLVELLLSMTILAILLVLCTTVLSGVQRAWSQAGGTASQFRDARRVFDAMKENLQQATLNTYERLRFDNPADPFSPFDENGNEAKNLNPSGYVRYSELQFRSGLTSNVLASVPGFNAAKYPGHAVFFQAALGASSKYPNLPTSINGCGYYVQYIDNSTYKPDFVALRQPTHYRYRLMEYAPPAENNLIYDETSRNVHSDWFTNVATWSRPIAENVIALIISPKRLDAADLTGDPRDIAFNYDYNSSNSSIAANSGAQSAQAYELPPALEILMIVVNEQSAEKLVSSTSATPSPILTGLSNSYFLNAQDDGFYRDLEAMERILVTWKISYRVFNATIPLRNSNWKG